jgi:hypothetical protein
MILQKKNVVSKLKKSTKNKTEAENKITTKVVGAVALTLFAVLAMMLAATHSPEYVRGEDSASSGTKVVFVPGELRAVKIIESKPQILPGDPVTDTGVAQIENVVSRLAFELGAIRPVSALSSKIEIRPGESVVQREEREKAEAEAKARLARAEKVLAEASRNRTVVTRERRVYSDPSTFDSIYIAAGNVYGVDPLLLRAIHQVETGGSGSTTRTSYMGATGPMQFLPSTWRRYGVDGNGDGYADIYNVEDAIFSAANYLRACGYPDIRKALWGYNPSNPYYNKVVNIARSYGMNI